MKDEFELMSEGKLYNSSEPSLVAKRIKARELAMDFNNLRPSELDKKRAVLSALFNKTDNIESAYFEPNIRVEYGSNVKFGKNFYMNYDCMLLDVAKIIIGDNVMFGPRVILATPMHPFLAEERIMQDYPNGFYNIEYAKPIKIGNNVWIASNVTICGGVTIGDNTVIASGAVVTKDIPSNVLAGGIPCKIIRQLNEDDRLNVWETYCKNKNK